MQVGKSTSDTIFSDFDTSHTYSRADAISDGILIDISDTDVAKQHYKYPIAVTAAIWSLIEKALANRKYANDLNGILHDILWMSRSNNRWVSESIRMFQVILRGAGRKSLFSMKISCGPGDDLAPVLTVMMADED